MDNVSRKQERENQKNVTFQEKENVAIGCKITIKNYLLFFANKLKMGYLLPIQSIGCHANANNSERCHDPKTRVMMAHTPNLTWCVSRII